MSLIDPQSRWWDRDSTRRAAAYACWGAGILLAGVGMWSIMSDGASPLPTWFGMVASLLPIMLIIGGTFFIAFGTGDRKDRERFSARTIVWPMAGYVIATGAGAIAGGLASPRGLDAGYLVFVVFVVGGVAAGVVAEAVLRRGRRASALRQRVQRSGITTTGVIARARSYSVNHRPVTKITVRFTDAEGRDRWASGSMLGSASVGERMQVRYSQADLGEKAAVILSRPER